MISCQHLTSLDVVAETNVHNHYHTVGSHPHAPCPVVGKRQLSSNVQHLWSIVKDDWLSLNLRPSLFVDGDYEFIFVRCSLTYFFGRMDTCGFILSRPVAGNHK